VPVGRGFATRSTVIAVDTNLLVDAHRADSPFHERARSIIEALAGGAREWAIPWPCAHEFFAVVTHPRIYRTATPAETAFAQLRALANLAFIGETDEYLRHLESLALPAQARGGAGRFTTRALRRSAFRTAWPSSGRPTATSPGFRNWSCEIP
jgi:uncharacterized protein